MKYIALLAVVLAGCSSSGPQYPRQQLIVDNYVSAMSRHEVINAIQDCESNNLRAVMITAKKNVNGHITDVISDVTCAPRFKF